MRAVVIGAGIGGLCAAIGLRRRGWEVTVLERRAAPGAEGSGVTLMANGLRGLDALGVGAAVRGEGRAGTPGGARTSDGRWLSRIEGESMSSQLGTTAVGIHRATLHRILLNALPPETVIHDAQVTDVDPGPPPTVVVRGHDVRHPDLVVAADGIGSRTRSRLWPGHPDPVPSGSMAWLGVTTGPWPHTAVTTVTWGRGEEFGMVPLGDGRVYWWASANAPSADGDLHRRFGAWHDPIPALLDATDPASIIRVDLRHLGTPLPSYRKGSVVVLGDAAHAMTPNLGQGANQAIEDAVVLAAMCDPLADLSEALDAYDRTRRPRSQNIARAALRMSRFGQQLTNPLAVATRNAVMRWTPPRTALRTMSHYADWQPPDPR
ncbi:FAD-dependent oxidoreductase [Actinoplanes friuliensis]|uniref:FAD-dependent oxidoreductase n=1 Tax=Actinoplanes friuliensis TaxID=196914 RepID=UPI000409B615|nr:FAD-dependent oxidoreductase [Actinoplanes friuliensis]